MGSCNPLFLASACQAFVPYARNYHFLLTKGLHSDLTDDLNTGLHFLRSDFEIWDKYATALMQHGFQLILLLTISLKWDFIQPNLKMEVYHRTADGLSVIWYMPMLLKFLTYNLILRKRSREEWKLTTNTVFSLWKDLRVFPCLTWG